MTVYSRSVPAYLLRLAGMSQALADRHVNTSTLGTHAFFCDVATASVLITITIKLEKSAL